MIRPIIISEDSQSAIGATAKTFFSDVQGQLPDGANGDLNTLVSAIQAVMREFIENSDDRQKLFPGVGNALGIAIGANIHEDDRVTALMQLSSGISAGIAAVTKIHDTQGNA